MNFDQLLSEAAQRINLPVIPTKAPGVPPRAYVDLKWSTLIYNIAHSIEDDSRLADTVFIRIAGIHYPASREDGEAFFPVSEALMDIGLFQPIASDSFREELANLAQDGQLKMWIPDSLLEILTYSAPKSYKESARSNLSDIYGFPTELGQPATFGLPPWPPMTPALEGKPSDAFVPRCSKCIDRALGIYIQVQREYMENQLVRLSKQLEFQEF